MAFFEIQHTSEGLLKEKGSRFLAFAYPVKSKEEVLTHLQALRKTYYDARHHCYAYRLGKEGEISFVNDDGEPAHTAGDPILGQLRARGLTHTLVVVIRYFGGTLLGVRGLIEAYKGAAAAALDNNTPVEIIPVFTFTLFFPYEQTSEVNKTLHPFPVEVLTATYTETCTQTLRIRKTYEAALKAALTQARIVFEEVAEE